MFLYDDDSVQYSDAVDGSVDTCYKSYRRDSSRRPSVIRSLTTPFFGQVESST